MDGVCSGYTYLYAEGGYTNQCLRQIKNQSINVSGQAPKLKVGRLPTELRWNK